MDELATYVGSVVRGVVASMGGALIAAGYATTEQWTMVAGAAGVAVTILWGLVAKKMANKKLEKAVAAPAGKAE